MSENPTTDLRTLELSVNDGSNTSNTLSQNINVVPVNDKPQLLVSTGLTVMNFDDIVAELEVPNQVTDKNAVLSSIERAEIQLASLLSLEPLQIDESGFYQGQESNPGLLLSIEKMQNDLQRASESFESGATVRDTIVGFWLNIAAGFLVWILRGGALLASMFSISPIWKQLDPLPISYTSSAVSVYSTPLPLVH